LRLARSLTIAAQQRPAACDNKCFNTVVLPAPRNPLNMMIRGSLLVDGWIINDLGGADIGRRLAIFPAPNSRKVWSLLALLRLYARQANHWH
jgi:hypothetical protein